MIVASKKDKAVTIMIVAAASKVIETDTIAAVTSLSFRPCGVRTVDWKGKRKFAKIYAGRKKSQNVSLV